MLVADASVVATALTDDGSDGDRARARLRGERLAAPELLDLEVVSVLRGQLRAGALDARRAELALTDLRELPLQRAPHGPLLARCWELRDNLTLYDAAYVALAEALGADLLTADRMLSKAPGPLCHIEFWRPDRCIPDRYHLGMSTQIAVRLPDEAVSFIDRQVSSGAAKSRADFIWRAIKREQRRLAAEHDAEIYAQLGEDPELQGLAEYAARLPRPELD